MQLNCPQQKILNLMFLLQNLQQVNPWKTIKQKHAAMGRRRFWCERGRLLRDR